MTDCQLLRARFTFSNMQLSIYMMFQAFCSLFIYMRVDYRVGGISIGLAVQAWTLYTMSQLTWRVSVQ